MSNLDNLIYIEAGLASARPTTPSGKVKGWYATDTDTLSLWDGDSWDDVGGGSVSFNTPAIVLGSSAAAGSGSDVIRHNSTIAAFDATNPTTQDFGDAAAVGTAAFAARRDHKHAMPSLPVGSLELVYRYTVTGSDKASIDTGADTADAGTNDWTNGDVLEVWFYARTDEAVVQSSYNLTFNNDGTSVYDFTRLINTNTTVIGASAVAQAAVFLQCPGASCASGVFGATRLSVPNSAGTVANKAGEGSFGVPDTTAANMRILQIQFEYRSTTALSRLAVTPNTATKKFKVGSQLLIYRRRSA